MLYSRIGFEIHRKGGDLLGKRRFLQTVDTITNEQRCICQRYELVYRQSPNYINGIENGENYPSMATFFYICDYFGITPRDFFDIDADNPSKANELLEIAKSLPNEQLDILIALAKGLKK